MTIDRRRSNPSSILYWSDIRNDPKLRRCSPAAKGIWAVHMLPAAAESPEYGVVTFDGLPSLARDLGALFAREIGETVGATQALIDELVTMGAASVDDQGRVFCRRMVREEKLRQQRSAAGKLGGAAKHARWQTSVETPVESGVETHGGGSGKNANGARADSASRPATNGHVPANGSWQTPVEHVDETMPSSLSSLSSRPSHPSLEQNLVPYGTRDDAADLLAAFNAWNEAAARVGRWPVARKFDADRRKAIRARIKDAGGLAAFLDVLAKAEASQFCRESMNCFALDWLLKPANFRKCAEDNYADGRRGKAPVVAGHVDVLQDVVEAFRRKEQQAGGLQ